MASSSVFLLMLFFFIATCAFATGMGVPAEKVVQLHFYSVNLTMATVATLNNTSSGFGNINVLDSALTEVPVSAGSEPIGRVQGMAAGTSLASQTFLTSLNFVFTGGKYNGSTLAVYGREVVGVPAERAIVGGSGQFRLARGFIESKVFSSTARDIVVEFRCYVILHKD